MNIHLLRHGYRYQTTGYSRARRSPELAHFHRYKWVSLLKISDPTLEAVGAQSRAALMDLRAREQAHSMHVVPYNTACKEYMKGGNAG